MKRNWLLLGLALGTSGLAHGQKAEDVLAKAAAAFSQGEAVNSVTLNATAEWIAGSDDQMGNAILTASADGSFTVQLQLANSSRTEAQSSFSSGQSCIWSGTDGVAHPVSSHNCKATVAWFLPSVSLLGNQRPSSLNVSLLTTPNPTPEQLLNVRLQRAAPVALSSEMAALSTHIATVDLYLDTPSYLPAGLAFNLHPDGNSASDIPVQVVFTNYQVVNGVALPFRIQRYMNGVLNLDLTVTQASTN